MKALIKLSVSLVLFIFLLPTNIKAQCHIDDWTALKALYESTDGDNWTINSGWVEVTGNQPNANCNLANLYGIGLDENERVSFIGLSPPNDVNNNLSGTIPNEIKNLTYLYWLDLSNNQLIGNIPLGIFNLENLATLDLSNNNLTNYIPSELGNLIRIAWLDLSNNELIGSIPPEIVNLDFLKWFFVNNNNLSGCFPKNINSLCDQLHSVYSSISNGNNFDATWIDFCNTGAGTCIPTNVYPGDLNHDGIVNNQDVGLWGLFLHETGTPRAAEHQNTNWNPYPAEDWNRQQINNEDIKHFDTNGNGAIEDDDCQAVTDNFGQSWSPTTTIEMPASPQETDYQVMLHPIDEIVDGFLVMNVALERRTGGSIELRGGHFTVDYADIPGNISAVALNFEPFSWLGVPTIDLWYESTPFPTEKKIEVGFTKTDNVNSEGNGVIGQLILAYDNGGARLSKKSNMYEFRVNTIGVHNSEIFTQMEDQVLQVNIDNSTYCQTNWSIDEDTPFQNQYKSNSNITSNGFVMIGKDQEVLYQAGSIILNSGFSVKAGANFKIKIGGCNE